MALENATYLNGLVATNPLSTDVVSQADDHLRLIKQVLLNTFPNLTGPVTQTQDQLNYPFPPGGIILWSGSLASVPSGWYLCNGANGTPDLRDRFVVGAGNTYAVGNTGGAASVVLTSDQMPAHTHSITASSDTAGAHTHTITDPGHSHSYSGGQAVSNGYFPGGSIIAGGSNYTAAATTGISINSGGAHTHTISATAGTTGGGIGHENRPPYYALAYIMKG
jgi:microcystin-dependent protein